LYGDPASLSSSRAFEVISLHELEGVVHIYMFSVHVLSSGECKYILFYAQREELCIGVCV
jgi:hypothetical protein